MEIRNNKYLETLTNLLEVYGKAVAEFDAKKEQGEEFNVFYLINDIYGISEPRHSKFLAFLLNPYETHGQKDKFLKLFLETEELKDLNFDGKNRTWEVTAENNHADILIQSECPDKISIVIENKCFDAVDQENQLYRYWHDHIYDFFGKKEDAEDKSKCRIIYLPNGDWKNYTENSISKPDYIEDEQLKEYDKLDIEKGFVTKLTFYKHITNWLENCLNEEIPERIKHFISDYKKYWEETNFKELFIMEELNNYFTNKKDDWKNFNELCTYKDTLKNKWEENFKSDCESLATNNTWYYYDEGVNDIRFHTNENGKTAFVYEYELGLTIWKCGISVAEKEKIKDRFEIFKDDFDFIDGDFNKNCNYIMKYREKEGAKIILNEEEFIWEAENGNLFEDIKGVLEKYFKKVEVINLFNELDNINS
jgi:hypothetical protein